MKHLSLFLDRGLVSCFDGLLTTIFLPRAVIKTALVIVINNIINKLSAERCENPKSDRLTISAKLSIKAIKS